MSVSMGLTDAACTLTSTWLGLEEIGIADEARYNLSATFKSEENFINFKAFMVGELGVGILRGDSLMAGIR